MPSALPKNSSLFSDGLHHADIMLNLTLACAGYDRTRALVDGRIAIDGVTLQAATLHPEQSFSMAKKAHFDLTELSLSGYLGSLNYRTNAYIALPVFLSRAFRHSAIYIRTDRNIRTPGDLQGKTIGVPDYNTTANVWLRGILHDHYGLAWTKMKWVRGKMEADDPLAALPPPPTDVQVRDIGADDNLSAMLQHGELDAIMGARVPSCFTSAAPHIGRLFADYPAAEKAYFQHTRIFPIMHVLGLRQSLHQAHPWLVPAIYRAFLQAKAIAMSELADICQPACTLPWLVDAHQEARLLMGDDYWPYGLPSNRDTIDTFIRYHHEQGLSSSRLTPEQLFAAGD